MLDSRSTGKKEMFALTWAPSGQSFLYSHYILVLFHLLVKRNKTGNSFWQWSQMLPCACRSPLSSCPKKKITPFKLIGNKPKPFLDTERFPPSLHERYLPLRLPPQAMNWQLGHYDPLGSDWLWGSLLLWKMWNWLSGRPRLTWGILHLTWL